MLKLALESLAKGSLISVSAAGAGISCRSLTRLFPEFPVENEKKKVFKFRAAHDASQGAGIDGVSPLQIVNSRNLSQLSQEKIGNGETSANEARRKKINFEIAINVAGTS